VKYIAEDYALECEVSHPAGAVGGGGCVCVRDVSVCDNLCVCVPQGVGGGGGCCCVCASVCMFLCVSFELVIAGIGRAGRWQGAECNGVCLDCWEHEGVATTAPLQLRGVRREGYIVVNTAVANEVNNGTKCCKQHSSCKRPGCLAIVLTEAKTLLTACNVSDNGRLDHCWEECGTIVGAESREKHSQHTDCCCCCCSKHDAAGTAKSEPAGDFVERVCGVLRPTCFLQSQPLVS
jgi:hypothetical protein